MTMRIDWRYLDERGPYKDDNSKNRGFTLIDADEKDGKVVIADLLESFYEDMKEPVKIVKIRKEEA